MSVGAKRIRDKAFFFTTFPRGTPAAGAGRGSCGGVTGLDAGASGHAASRVCAGLPRSLRSRFPTVLSYSDVSMMFLNNVICIR